MSEVIECYLPDGKVIFTSLNYWMSARFLPRLQNRSFGLLELAIPVELQAGRALPRTRRLSPRRKPASLKRTTRLCSRCPAAPQARILSLPTRFNVLDFSGRQSLQSGRQEQSRPRWQGTAREVRASLPSRPPARKPGGPHLDGGGRELCVARLLCGEAGKKGGLEIVTMDLLSSCGRSGAAEDEVVDLKVLVPAGFERRLDLPGEWIRLCC